MGVTVIVPEIGTLVTFVAANAGILSIPLAPRPIAVLLLVQVNDVAVPKKETADVDSPVHTTWLPGWLTDGMGFTVLVKVFDVPVQVTPPEKYIGVTVIVPEIGIVVLFVAVKDGIFPEPLALRPIAVLLLVQLNEVAVPKKETAAVASPAQRVSFSGWFTMGAGFTVIVNIFSDPEQVTPPEVYCGVTVIVPEIGALLVFIAVKEGI